MYQLLNTMAGENARNQLVSQHKTLVTAIKANDKLQHQIKTNNGKNNYLPTRILNNWEPVDVDEFEAAVCEVRTRQ